MALKNLRKIQQEIVCPPKEGDIVEGAIIATDRSCTFLDLGAKGIGVIYGEEFQKAKETLKNMEIGSKITAKVVGLETEEGYRELSLSAAEKEIAWEDLKNRKEQGEILDLKVKSANKGGLVCNMEGIQGFVPVSHLTPEHYPKLDNPDGAKIARALEGLVGQTLQLKIIDINPSKEKLILSEKSAQIQQQEQDLTQFSSGDKIKGSITGITSFGAFVNIGKGIEALLPSKEIPQDNDEQLEVGQKIEAAIKEIKDSRVYITLQQDEKEEKTKSPA